MKININVLKFYLVVPFIFCDISLNAQTRNVKMEYKIIDPIKNKEIRVNESIPIAIRLYNYGPDTLWTCDSFLMYFSVSMNYTGTQQHKIFILDKPLFPGDSSDIITDTAHWEWPFTIETDRYISLNTSLALFGTDYSHPKGNYVNISGVEGQKDNSNVKLLVRRTTASVEDELVKERQNIVLYPNPIKGNKTTLKGIDASSILEINCMDISGRILQCAYSSSGNETVITLPNRVSGIYFLSITTDEIVITKKVIRN